MTRASWKNLAFVVGTLALVAGLFAPSGVADGRPLIVTLDEPFEIDGEMYPPGKVTVKRVQAYNPSSLLSEVWVDRKCLGVFQASAVEEGGDSKRSSLTFVRTGEGHLALVGFATGRENSKRAYRFHLQARAVDLRTASAKR